MVEAASAVEDKLKQQARIREKKVSIFMIRLKYKYLCLHEHLIPILMVVFHSLVW